VLESARERFAGKRLAVLAAQLDDVARTGVTDMQVLNRLAAIDAVERVGRTAGQVLLLILTDVLDASLERDRQADRALRDENLADGFGVFAQFQAGDLLFGRDALEVHGLNHQAGLLEQLEAGGAAIHTEDGPDRHLRFFPRISDSRST